MLKTIFTLAVMMSMSLLKAEESWTSFERFVYQGTDPYAKDLKVNQYLNPILAGFYPDPSVCRVGEDYYLVNSSFAYFPGVPIFHSRDLVNWKQIGNVLDRPTQIHFVGHGVSAGVYAPAITFHEGLFYMITTGVGGSGNFFVTAKDPAGPWSEPTIIHGVDGIDPAFWFEDGKAYVVNCASPDGTPLYNGHRAIRLREIDLVTGKTTGFNKVLVNGGMHIEKKPIWSEGPHIFKHNDWYYLSCAEGGTGSWHSQMIYRSKQFDGPYEAYEGNPILTQRDLPKDRVDPVTCTGHADLVETADGKWYAVFLGVRTYADDQHNLGRETFMLPVTWKDGWPMILEKGKVVPRVVDKDDVSSSLPSRPTGTFEKIDEFNSAKLGFEWLSLREDYSNWAKIEKGVLRIDAREPKLTSNQVPAFIGRRQQHENFSAQTELIAGKQDCQAGMAAFQGEGWHYFFGATIKDGQVNNVFLEKVTHGKPEIVVQQDVSGDRMQMKITSDGPTYSFFYQLGTGPWQQVGPAQDGTILSTKQAGGFVGTVVGMHVRKSPN